jgi:homoserine dehydrogenase
MMKKTVRLMLAGLGNVGRSLLEIMQMQRDLLREQYRLDLKLVAAVDSGGAAVDQAGLDLNAVLGLKRERRSVAELAGKGQPGVDGIAIARTIEADILLEATPVNLQTGEPGLETTRSALRRGISAVLANKGPLALAYQELAGLSDLVDSDEERGNPTDWPALRFSACVGGSMPTINIGRRDLAGARILRFEAVLNGTTQGILRAMEEGTPYEDALAEMQRLGLAETDPSLDIDGWDAANKLTIVANAVLRRPTTVREIAVEGIRGLTSELLRDHVARGERIVLLCLAERVGTGYQLSVRPTPLPIYHPLARMGEHEMGLVYYTDIAGVATATTLERDPVPTAAAMLRDIIEISNR